MSTKYSLTQICYNQKRFQKHGKLQTSIIAALVNLHCHNGVLFRTEFSTRICSGEIQQSTKNLHQYSLYLVPKIYINWRYF